MEPTTLQLVNRHLASQGVPVVDAETLNSNQNSLEPNTFEEPAVPPVPEMELTQPEKEVSVAQKEIQRLQKEGLGESEFRSQLEEERDIEGKTQTVTDLENRVRSLTAEAQQIPLQMQEEARGRGITEGGLRPLQTARIRTNAIQTLGANAQLQAAQGNLTTALDLIDRKVKAQFDPIKEEIAVAKSNLELLLASPELSVAEKNRALATQAQLDQRNAQIEARATEEKAKEEVILNAIQYGADSKTIDEMQDINSDDALKLAVQKGYIDQSYILDMELKKVQLKKQQAELTVYERYGGLTPSQYLSQIEKKQKQIKAEEQADKEAQKAEEQAMKDALLLDTSISQIDAVINSSALETVVGGTFLSRGMGRQKEGFAGKTISFIKNALTLGTTSGLLDEISGSADDTVALTQQILDKQFLDKLIEVKSKGATFGALSDNEGQALRNAANAIANAAIKDDTDRVIGYDMSEKEFKSQMKRIKMFMDIARRNATGESLNSDEKDLLDNVFGATEEFNPAF